MKRICYFKNNPTNKRNYHTGGKKPENNLLCTKSSEKMDQNKSNCKTTKMYSNFPPSSQSSSWENEFVVKIKWKRRKQSRGGINRSSGTKTFNANNVRKSFCGKNATMSSYNHIALVIFVAVIFNSQITLQRPVHNHVEKGSLTSAMVREHLSFIHKSHIKFGNIMCIKYYMNSLYFIDILVSVKEEIEKMCSSHEIKLSFLMLMQYLKN
jgi:hypothetical protein